MVAPPPRTFCPPPGRAAERRLTVGFQARIFRGVFKNASFGWTGGTYCRREPLYQWGCKRYGHLSARAIGQSWASRGRGGAGGGGGAKPDRCGDGQLFRDLGFQRSAATAEPSAADQIPLSG